MEHGCSKPILYFVCLVVYILTGIVELFNSSSFSTYIRTQIFLKR